MFIDPKSRKAPPAEKYPHVYDMNFEAKVSSCGYFFDNFKFYIFSYGFII